MFTSLHRMQPPLITYLKGLIYIGIYASFCIHYDVILMVHIYLTKILKRLKLEYIGFRITEKMHCFNNLTSKR